MNKTVLECKLLPLVSTKFFLGGGGAMHCQDRVNYGSF